MAGGARRRDAAAPALPRVQLRRRGERTGGDAPGRPHVPQVRRRLDQAESLRRQLHAERARRHHVDERRGGGGRGEGGEDARQARVRPRAVVRVDQAERAPRHRRHLPRELHRRGGARHARGHTATGIFVAPGIGILNAMLYAGGAVGDHPRQGRRHGLRGGAGGGRRVAQEDAQARHPHPARRRLRVRLHAARRERARPGATSSSTWAFTPMEAIFSATKLRRRDHGAAAASSASSGTATWPTCSWSTATRSPTSRSCAIPRRSSPS